MSLPKPLGHTARRAFHDVQGFAGGTVGPVSQPDGYTDSQLCLLGHASGTLPDGARSPYPRPLPTPDDRLRRLVVDGRPVIRILIEVDNLDDIWRDCRRRPLGGFR